MFAISFKTGRIPFLSRVAVHGLVIGLCCGAPAGAFLDVSPVPGPAEGVVYTNWQIPNVPLSIHLVRVPRPDARFEIHTQHARGRALGLGTVSSQLALLDPRLGTPVAAVNGDFYQRDRGYAGDPRGLQIIEGEVISAPTGGVSFWVDGLGQFQMTNVTSLFQVRWPDGSASPFGLNQERGANAVVLYTPALGPSTRTDGGREFVLEPAPGSPWLPLRLPRIYTARVRKIYEGGDAPLEAGAMVLSVGPALVSELPPIVPGSLLWFSTASFPGLRAVKVAISGGPVLVRNGKPQKIPAAARSSYEYTSMFERHPRAAIGWNHDYYFLVEVDGRQPSLSMGMTLPELSKFLVELGCEQAMNLDGGGSATLWYCGKVRNSPCDGHERAIANSLVVLEKRSQSGTSNAASLK